MKEAIRINAENCKGCFYIPKCHYLRDAVLVLESRDPRFIPTCVDYLKKEKKEVSLENAQEGNKYDQGKLRWDLLPEDALEEVVKVFTKGSIKYKSWNWQKGLSFSRMYAALRRHLKSWWWDCEEKDPELDVYHLAQVAFYSLTMLHFILHREKFKKFDDRPGIKDENISIFNEDSKVEQDLLDLFNEATEKGIKELTLVELKALRRIKKSKFFNESYIITKKMIQYEAKNPCECNHKDFFFLNL